MKPLRALCLFTVLFSTIVLAQSNPVPFVNQPLVPATIAPGSKGFTLTVNGTGFASTAVVYWNGSTRITQFISSSQLKVTIEAKDVAKASTASIYVENPSPGGGASNFVFFSIRDPGFSVAMYPAPDFPANSANAVGDFNNDGKLDVAVGLTNADGSGEIDIYLGKGDGNFDSAAKTASVTRVTSMLAADFTNDGKLDLAVLDGEHNLTIFLGQGNGKLVQSQVLNSPISGLAAGDFNHDGKLDLVVTGRFGFPHGGLYLYLGNGDGTFEFFKGFSGACDSTGGQGGPAIGDFNGDGNLDVAAADGYYLHVFLGNGDGTFQNVTCFSMGNNGGYSVATADVNGDGILDVVTNGLTVMLGKGDGTFAESFQVNFNNYSPANANLGDFNGDGILDAALLVNSTLDLLLGKGDGTFQSPIAFPVGNKSTSLSTGNFNPDGKLDLVGGNLFLQTSASLTPSSFNFGNENVGTTSPPQTATLENVGSSSLTIQGIGINGADPNDFSQSSNCPASLSVGNSCQIQVTFKPTTTGMRSASLYVNFQGFGNPQTVALSGTGVDLTVTLNPSSMTFSTQLINTTSSPQTATLTNTGSQDVTISSISTTAQFGQTNNCPSSLPPNNQCQIKVTFTPTTEGQVNGQLSVTDNAAGSPQTVTLSGTGTVVELSPPGINFGNQKVGTRSPAAPVKLTNKGSTSLSISQIDITGTDSGDFSQTNNCGNSIPAGGQCTIKVRFKPTAKGQRLATLDVNDDGGGSPQTVALSGTGT
jgi:hypothetical protein